MADVYVQKTVPELKERGKERGLHVKKGLKKEELIKLLCDSDSATEPSSCTPTPESSPELHPHTRSLEPSEGSPPVEGRWRYQIQLEAEGQGSKRKYELELKRLEQEAQHQHEELELKRMEHEAREARLKREHELAVIQMQANANTAGAQPAQDASSRLNTPIFSRYKDGDDPEVFLSIFKNQACRWKLPKEEFMRHMVALVEGDMSVVLNSLPSESADNYDAFKNAVSSRFKLGPDYFQKKFRNIRPQPEQTMADFVALVWDALLKRADRAKAGNLEKVLYLMVLDQFYHCCLREIKTLVKDGAPKTIQEAAEIVDQLLLNREGPDKKPLYFRKEQKGSKEAPKRGEERARSRRGKKATSC
ncbi:hypothetical protein Y1Q_0021089 [Alligator mississippiensis]|uniref:SCAN box domain-containing protein n=1 Tax=Alligator mississippiensis TaxID=8496 RepID=A0A151NS44_ALLMI|nr:hypothetical protein Y1Q_0021089 [Alligator mississippiensis]